MRYLLSAARVVPGPAGEHSGSGAVVVEGESIVAVGSHGEVSASARADVVELAFPAATIVPGLVNAHVHLAFSGGPDRLAQLLVPRW